MIIRAVIIVISIAALMVWHGNYSKKIESLKQNYSIRVLNETEKKIEETLDNHKKLFVYDKQRDNPFYPYFYQMNKNINNEGYKEYEKYNQYIYNLMKRHNYELYYIYGKAEEKIVFIKSNYN